jgi:hypothetical protein
MGKETGERGELERVKGKGQGKGKGVKENKERRERGERGIRKKRKKGMGCRRKGGKGLGKAGGGQIEGKYKTNTQTPTKLQNSVLTTL